ncbi:MAG: LON peptidase substrate-binding domain-containing protein [Desulfobacterales bacterium]|nr:LON peptidase substrate-binding domain-containing protein [Desulfobacterales bacterium]
MAEADRDDLISIIEEDDKTTEIPTNAPAAAGEGRGDFHRHAAAAVRRAREIRARGGGGRQRRRVRVSWRLRRTRPSKTPPQDDIYRTGTVGRVLRMLKLPDGRVKVLVQGLAKGTIAEVRAQALALTGCRSTCCRSSRWRRSTLEVEALMRNVREQSEKILALRGELNPDITSILQNVDDPGKLADLVASNLRLKIEDVPVAAGNPGAGRAAEARQRPALAGAGAARPCRPRSSPRSRTRSRRASGTTTCASRCGPSTRSSGEHDERSIEIDEYQRKIKKAQHAQGGQRGGPEAAQAAGADAPGLGRVHRDPVLPRLAGGDALEQGPPRTSSTSARRGRSWTGSTTAWHRSRTAFSNT